MKGWEFFKDAKGFWRWTRKAENGEVIAASSEGFVAREDCVDNAVFSGYVREPETEIIMSMGESRIGTEHDGSEGWVVSEPDS